MSQQKKEKTKMKTNHADCINKVRESIKNEGPHIKWVSFDLSTISDGKIGNMTGQRITVGYTHTNKHGVEVQKEEKSFITHIYCPFCGKKY